MTKVPTWAALISAQLAEIDALDIPYMLDKLAEMQEFIDHTRQCLNSMQRRQADIERHLKELGNQP